MSGSPCSFTSAGCPCILMYGSMHWSEKWLRNLQDIVPDDFTNHAGTSMRMIRAVSTMLTSLLYASRWHLNVRDQRCVNQDDITDANCCVEQCLTVAYRWSSTKISRSRSFRAISQQLHITYGKVCDAIWDYIGAICCVFHTTPLLNSPINYRHIVNICTTRIVDPSLGVRSLVHQSQRCGE